MNRRTAFAISLSAVTALGLGTVAVSSAVAEPPTSNVPAATALQGPTAAEKASAEKAAAEG